MIPIGVSDLQKYWFGSGFLPDGTKSLPESMLTSREFCGIHQSNNLQAVLKTSILKWVSKITLLQLQPRMLR